MEPRVLLSATLDWVVPIDGGASVFQNALVVQADGQGNVYAGGSLRGTVDFDRTAGVSELTSGAQFGDGWVAKYSNAGALLWVKQFVGTGSEQSRVKDLAIDDSGNVFVVGTFSGTVDLDPGAATQSVNNSVTGTFLTQLDSDGDSVWAEIICGANVVNGNALALAADGSLFLGGSFQGTIDFDPGVDQANLTSVNADTITGFLAQYDSSGGNLGAWAFQTTANNSSAVQNVAVDAAGAVIIAGTFRTDLDADPGEGSASLQGTGIIDGFVAKLTDGELTWSAGIHPAATGIAAVDGLAVDDQNNIYFGGQYTDSVDVDPGAGTQLITTPTEFSKPFLASLDSDGAFRWGAGPAGGISEGELRDISVINGATAADARIIAAGYFNGTAADFDPGAATFPLTAGESDAFIWTLNGEGAFVDAWAITGSTRQDLMSLAVDPTGPALVTAGSYSVTTDFQPGSGSSSVTTANLFASAFVAYYSSLGSANTAGISGETTLVSSVFPAAVVSGVAARGSAKVRFVNTSGATFPATTRATVSVFAHLVGAGDSSQDFRLGVLNNQSIGRLADGAAKIFTVPLLLPTTTPEGEYELTILIVNTADESSIATGATEAGFSVADPFINLQTAIDATRLPDSGTAGDGVTIRLPVSVINAGNSAVARGATIDVQVFARPAAAVDSSEDVLVGELSNSPISSLRAGATKKVTVNVQLPIALAGGDYNLVATVDSSNDVAESDETDNSADSSSAGVIAVAAGFNELTPTLLPDRLVSSVVAGTAVRSVIQIRVTNNSNVKLPKGQIMMVQVVARPVEGGEDVLLGAPVRAVSLNAFAPGRTATVSVPISLPDTLLGEYQIVGIIDTGDQIAEANEDNNEVVRAENLVVAEAQVEFDITSASHGFAAAVSSRDTSTGAVVFRNSGNVTAAGNVDIAFYATGDGTIGEGSVVLGQLTAQSINLRPGVVSRSYTVPLTISGTLETGTYTIVAQVTPSTGANFTNFQGLANTMEVGADIDVTFVAAPPTAFDPALVSSILSFTRNTRVAVGGNFLEEGTVRDADGRTGTYIVQIISLGTPITRFSLTFTPAGEQPLIIARNAVFSSATARTFAGHSVEFSRSPLARGVGTILDGDGEVEWYFRFV